MENKIQHLQMIQSVINRMAQCSFYLKGWTVVLVSALFALAAKDANVRFIILAYLPAVAFWFLDGYYLHQERLFRKLYNDVRLLPEANIDFTMNCQSFRTLKGLSWTNAVLSKTILLFHGALILTIIVVMIIALIQMGRGS
jgi:hypothetical protein